MTTVSTHTRFRRTVSLAVPGMALLACALILSPGLSAYESDQFSGRLVEIADSRELLNAEVNRALEEIAAGWKHGRKEKRFARAIFWKIGGFHWVDKLERWANRSDVVEKLPKKKRRGIYAGLPFWSTRFAGLFGTAQTIRVNGVLIGSDKIGHFLSQGHKYHRRLLRGNSPERVLRLGVRNERSIFGQMTTGVYSNADLVANYEGYLFYLSLFLDGAAADKPAIMAWDGNRPYLQRSFDWADHVNDFWDEALNPSRYDRLLQKHVVRNLKKLCPDYFAAPELFVPRRYAELARRYEDVGLRDTSYNRLDRVCGGPPKGEPAPEAVAPAPGDDR